MPVEEQLLPHKSLKPYYEKISWLYVCRTFKKRMAKDAEALRTHDRFGISSWPQMMVFDPRTDAVLAHTPRDLAGFKATLDRVLKNFHPKLDRAAGKAIAEKLRKARRRLSAKTAKPPVRELRTIAAGQDEFEGWLEARELLSDAGAKLPATEALQDPDPRNNAISLEELSGANKLKAKLRERALQLVRDEKGDIVVRIRALRLLRAHAPESLSQGLGALLSVENDPWLYEVLGLMKAFPNPSFGPALTAFLESIGKGFKSNNPNVLRIRVVECLADSGDASCVGQLIELLGGALNNGLTRSTPRILAKIGKRLGGAAASRIGKGLIEAVPAPIVGDAQTKQSAFAARMATAMAKQIAAAMANLKSRGKTRRSGPKVGRSWTEDDRGKFVKALRKLAR